MVFMVTPPFGPFLYVNSMKSMTYSVAAANSPATLEVSGRASRLVGNSVQMVQPMGHLGVYMPQWFTVATSES